MVSSALFLMLVFGVLTAEPAPYYYYLTLVSQVDGHIEVMDRLECPFHGA